MDNMSTMGYRSQLSDWKGEKKLNEVVGRNSCGIRMASHHMCGSRFTLRKKKVVMNQPTGQEGKGHTGVEEFIRRLSRDSVKCVK